MTRRIGDEARTALPRHATAQRAAGQLHRVTPRRAGDEDAARPGRGGADPGGEGGGGGGGGGFGGGGGRAGGGWTVAPLHRGPRRENVGGAACRSGHRRV